MTTVTIFAIAQTILVALVALFAEAANPQGSLRVITIGSFCKHGS